MEDGRPRPSPKLSGICWIPRLSRICSAGPHSHFLNSLLVILRPRSRSRVAPNEGSLYFTIPAGSPLNPGFVFFGLSGDVPRRKLALCHGDWNDSTPPGKLTSWPSAATTAVSCSPLPSPGKSLRSRSRRVRLSFELCVYDYVVMPEHIHLSSANYNSILSPTP